MRIIVIGGTGVIGKAVVNELRSRHEVIVAAHKSGDVQVDITSADSIKALYEKIKDIDAVIATTGQVKFEDFMEMDAEKYGFGLHNKLMGQVQVVLIGRHYLNKGGSFTLTSGILSKDPTKAGTSASMVNGAIDSFVKAAAIEMPNNLRINAVSPTLLEETRERYRSYFPGFRTVSASVVALAYSKSVEGLQTGQIYEVTV